MRGGPRTGNEDYTCLRSRICKYAKASRSSKGINLHVDAGEVHAIMGPNGSGKSTLARALAGHPEYEVTGGEVIYEGKDLLEMDPGRARPRRRVHGVPVPGRDPRREQRLLPQGRAQREAEAPRRAELDAMEFMQLIKEKVEAARHRPERC